MSKNSKLDDDGDLFISEDYKNGKVKIGVNLMPSFENLVVEEQSKEPVTVDFHKTEKPNTSRYRCLNISEKTIKTSPPSKTSIKTFQTPDKFIQHDLMLSDAQRGLAEKLAGMIENVESRNQLIRQQLLVHKNQRFDLKKDDILERLDSKSEQRQCRAGLAPGVNNSDISVAPFKFDQTFSESKHSYRLGSIAKRQIDNSSIRKVSYTSRNSSDFNHSSFTK